MDPNFAKKAEGPSALPDGNGFAEFSKEIYSLLIQASQAANILPPNEDSKNFYSTRVFQKKMEECGEKVMGLVQKFISESDRDLSGLKELEETEVRCDAAVDVTDTLLEKVDTYFDEVNSKKTNPLSLSLTPKSELSKKGVKLALPKVCSVLRPQNKWLDDVDNSNRPFMPKLSSKPHAIISLEESLAADFGVMPTGEFVSAPHPYQAEIESLQPLPQQLRSCKEQAYAPLDQTPCEWIDTDEKLHGLLAHLSSVGEFAVDLEQHGYRTFQGFVCLMQISTRTHDFLIDTLQLRKSMQILNSVFTNPKIVKVFHGADSDIIWLQRDFGIYVVNMFDTGQASRVLDFPSASLAYLLKHLCSIDVDKKYQLADWRIRPLPSEMMKYAREDTHYLLYIYDRMRNILLERSTEAVDLMHVSLRRSRDVCLRRYEKDLFAESSYLEFLTRSGLSWTPRQSAVFRAVFKWRDTIARLEDESKLYVLPNNMLFQMAETIPVDATKLEICCKPLSPPLVRKNLKALLAIISYAADGSEKAYELIDSFASTSTKTTGFTTPISTKIASASADGSKPASRTTVANAIAATVAAASPTTTMPTEHGSGSHSPVMTTEQLYQTAGWVEQPTTLKGPPNIPYDMQISDGDSDEDDENDGQQPKSSAADGKGAQAKAPTSKRRIVAAKAKAAPLVDSSSDEELLDEEDRARVARIQTALTASSGSSIFQSLLPKMNDASKDAQDSASGAQTSATAAAEGGDTECNGSPATTTTSTDGSPKDPEREGEDSDTEELRAQVLNAPEGFDSPHATNTEEERVPQSLGEIFKLSKRNKNKKKNKDKKKLREDSPPHTTSAFFEDEAEEKSKRPKSSGPGRSEAEELANFMKKMGWIATESLKKTLLREHLEDSATSPSSSSAPESFSALLPTPASLSGPGSSHVPHLPTAPVVITISQRPPTRAQPGPPPSQPPPPPQWTPQQNAPPFVPQGYVPYPRGPQQPPPAPGGFPPPPPAGYQGYYEYPSGPYGPGAPPPFRPHQRSGSGETFYNPYGGMQPDHMQGGGRGTVPKPPNLTGRPILYSGRPGPRR